MLKDILRIKEDDQSSKKKKTPGLSGKVEIRQSTRDLGGVFCVVASHTQNASMYVKISKPKTFGVQFISRYLPRFQTCRVI